MWHSSVSPTREYDLPVSLSVLGNSGSSSGCDWLNSGRLEGIQVSSAGVDTTSVSVRFVKTPSGKHVAALGSIEGVSLVCGCDCSSTGVLTDDCSLVSDLEYLMSPVLLSLQDCIPLV